MFNGNNKYRWEITDRLLMHGALDQNIRTILYADIFEVKNPVFGCNDVKQSKMVWDAYNHFFNFTSDINPIFEPATDHKYLPFEDSFTFSEFRKRIKHDPRKKGICYSIVPYKKHHKGIDEYCESLIKSHIDGIDLGDSRNFESSEQLIDKISKLQSCEMYIGSVTSWSNLAIMFDIPVSLIVQEYPYASTSIFKQNHLVDRYTGWPVGFKPK